MKTNLHTSFIIMATLISLSLSANAQFSYDASQTYYVCNAAGSQKTISAFADNNGGTYSFWIDKRNGAAGTAIYGQHLDSLGNPLWPVNGKLFYQQNAKDIWRMKAVSWQNGILISWVQGNFNVGGDTLYCNYYNQNGVSQWAQPTVAANKQGSIIYVDIDNIEIFPNDSGATLTFALSASGGSTYFSFNRIDFAGNLKWTLDSISYNGNGYYYRTASDNYGGFYVAACTGGFSAPIFVGHYNLQGNLTIPTPVDITGTAGGRNNSQWKVICDNDTNAYIVWASYINSNISISKIKPDGTMPWGNARQLCAAAGQQENPDAIIKNDTIYSTWVDGRPGASNYFIYMQKTDIAGNMLWTPDGIQICNLISFNPFPKLTTSGNDIVATYAVMGGYRGQKIRPDSTIAWQQNGVLINVPTAPGNEDYQLIPSANGSVTTIWKEVIENICGARIRSNGTLTTIAELKESKIGLYPNPAQNQFSIVLPVGNYNNAITSIYNQMGELVFHKENLVDANNLIQINTLNFSAGFYFIKITSDELNASAKICIVK